MTSLENIKVQNLDHLGLIAGFIDELELVEQINNIVGIEKCEKVSPGHVVKALILNGLGFVSAPLYMFSRFFEGKATEHLIGEGVQPEHLNDDRIGRVLDKLYLAGLSELFTILALYAAKKFGVDLKTSHLDSSSFHLHGQYNNSLPQVAFIKGEINSEAPKWSDLEETIVPNPIYISRGYSRDHRPDLKQFILDLICSGDGDVPLLLRVADGNEADKAVFAKILCEFKNQLSLESLMVADSALYSAANLLLLINLKWLCRVPLTVSEAKQLVSELDSTQFMTSALPGYRFFEHQSNYGGVPQRWLVIESEKRRQSEISQFEKRLEKAFQEASKKLNKLMTSSFPSPESAQAAAVGLSSKLKYHSLSELSVREKLTSTNRQASKNSRNPQVFYSLQAKLVKNESPIYTERIKAGRFVLATNVLDKNELSNEEMLSEYKAQQSAERGFAFLKDPLFFTDSIFIKSPERIEALAMVMGLCLLVYSLAQRHLRLALKSAQEGIKNQLGKLTDRPTLRWIFQCFQSIHLLQIKGQVQISNLTSERVGILRFFPKSCRQYYLLI